MGLELQFWPTERPGVGISILFVKEGLDYSVPLTAIVVHVKSKHIVTAKNIQDTDRSRRHHLEGATQ